MRAVAKLHIFHIPPRCKYFLHSRELQKLRAVTVGLHYAAVQLKFGKSTPSCLRPQLFLALAHRSLLPFQPSKSNSA